MKSNQEKDKRDVLIFTTIKLLMVAVCLAIPIIDYIYVQDIPDLNLYVHNNWILIAGSLAFALVGYCFIKVFELK